MGNGTTVENTSAQLQEQTMVPESGAIYSDEASALQ